MEWKDFNTQGPSGSRKEVGLLTRQPPKQCAGQSGRGDQGGCARGLPGRTAGRWLPGVRQGLRRGASGKQNHTDCPNPRCSLCIYYVPAFYRYFPIQCPQNNWAGCVPHFSDREAETQRNWGDLLRITAGRWWSWDLNDPTQGCLTQESQRRRLHVTAGPRDCACLFSARPQREVRMVSL